MQTPAWIFTGQHAGIGLTFHRESAVFRNAIETCFRGFSRNGISNLACMPFDPERASNLDQTLYTQPALLRWQYALAEMLRSWHLAPDFVFGNSVAEFVATVILHLKARGLAAFIFIAQFPETGTGRVSKKDLRERVKQSHLHADLDNGDQLMPSAKDLGIRAETPTDCQNLGDIRQAIDTIDRTLVDLLGLRMGYVLEAARFKPDVASIPAPERVAAMLPERCRWAEENKLDPNFVVPLFSQIIQWFIQQQIRHWEQKNAPRNKAE
ncbi:isochorismate lyase [Agrobacterium tumefaciens]|nr:isochorismate lyase [Agrobacterium tumefaciens]TQN60678.1 isochorismate lyase [Agrobacterium tumefaciens]